MNTKPHTIKRSFSSIHLLSRLCLGLIGLIGLGFGFGFGFASPMLSAATLDDLQFTLINGDTEYAVSAVNPSTISGVVNIPATFNGLPVTQVKDRAFRSASQITSVVLPDSITSIGEYAFNSCRSVSSIVLPNSITEIGRSAFAGCDSITSVVLPNSLTTLSPYLFSSCNSLSSIVLPNSLTTIGEAAFYSCNSLYSIEFPASLTTIGFIAFKNSYNLHSMTFLGSAPTLEPRAFEDTGGSNITITVYDTYEASYDSWPSSYTFNVVPEPTEPVVLTALIGYNPSSGVLSVISEDEPSSVTVDLQHTDALGTSWTTLDASNYEVVTDSNTNSVTRNLIIDPETNPTGFYRLSAEQ